ncbi:rhomboid family intramembrane serine protease [Pseudoxanthomonas dokdonensis]|uniref:Membrane protein n=1 Tax=Pseudoxanthomonas dokdonensis TaxID=344882 RepID=A0A0R0CRS3_9GAMM|nr:rhomboid family intramembrane serine protease [Pseudoxanthomonas dokdonensis]KRG72107.1 membrane protein [Pseudoxanthomonas dokdonensis]
MKLPEHHTSLDPERQRLLDRSRLRRALNVSLVFVLVLVLMFSAQASFDWRALTITPQVPEGLLGILTAPLLHGSLEHITANAGALLILGTLAGSVYPRATLFAVPLVWLGAGLGPWLLGDAGSHHLGASGLTHGLMFMVFALGLLRRDRAAIAAGMIAFLFYGGMVLSILPREPGVSWQAHMGGAIGGLIAAIAFRKLDPQLPRKRYSWEDEEELDMVPANDELEPPAPHDVPVLWQRPADDTRAGGVVLRFPAQRTRDAPGEQDHDR